MKKALFLVLSLVISLTIYAQEIDPKVEAEYTAFYNRQVSETKRNIDIIKSKRENTGVLFLVNFSIDTLNKDKYVNPKPTSGATIMNNGKKVGTMDRYASLFDPANNYLMTFINKVKDKDSFLSFSYTPDEFVLNRTYDEGIAFFSITLKYAAGKLFESSFREISGDSAVKRYRRSPSSANLDEIDVPLKVEKCYFSASPLNSKSVYGKAVLATDAFYAASKDFSGKYIYKRYRMTVVFQSPVSDFKKY
jgi:hypothetical protein